MILLRLAWRNLWRSPRRTLLTLGAMVFCNTILVFMIGLQLGMYDLMINNTLRAFSGNLQIQATGYNEKPQMRRSFADATQLAQRVRDHINLDSVSARATGFALASSQTRSYGVQVLGVQPATEALVSTLPGLIKQGSYLSPDDAQTAVVGSVFARNIKVDIGDELTLVGSGKDGSIAATVVTVVGIFDSGISELDRNLLQMPLTVFQDVFSLGNDAHKIVISAANLDAAVKVESEISALIADHPDLTLLDWQTLNPGLQEAIQADFSSAWFMYGVLIVLVGFSVLNTVLMSVLERTREFGIVLALGLTPGRVGWVVMLESLLMGLAGFSIGAATGAALNMYFAINGFSYSGMQEMGARFNLPAEFYPEVSLIALTLGPGAILIATLLAAIYPALRIRGLQPVEAMRAV